ncbi:SpoIIE family protein phosphatase [Streptomyces sp. AN091965]|uniref:SpoIIE family protein phosphatase n=1 Tax=Streptomyces sp. AN091965 TaxID=2927803 RepID=UPI001F61CA29|nr:SpoIIE family protein phosphatase [Streptomyces sp. AN091965]MCI3930633.1 SpoIIE family protein phosphatase [Streptomyces sp. AN091965]
MQRETAVRASVESASRPGPSTVVRTSLPGNPLAPSAARRFVRAALADWVELAVPAAARISDRLVDDAVLLVSELVTNAVVHAGTSVELLCRLDEVTPGEGPCDGLDALVVEVSDHHPARAVRSEPPSPHPGTPEYGRGLQLVATLAESWGITYRSGTKTVWARLPVDNERILADLPDFEAYAGDTALQRGLRSAEILAPAPKRVAHDTEWINRGALTFLAEASDMLAGQFDENLVAALAGQLLVPRLADWCAVWLDDEADSAGRAAGARAPGTRLARVWHTSEQRIEELRRVLEKEPPSLADTAGPGAVPVSWPGDAFGGDSTGAAVAYRLVAGGRSLGALVIGRAGLPRFPDEVTGLVEDFSRRVALAISAARRYQRQATISRVLQRGLLPSAVAEIPGVQSGVVYEPREQGGPGGDFYDVFPAGDGRWCFALGDVQGKGPEAAVVIGLARPWLRLLAREGYQVAEVLDRLNQLLLDDATEAADAAAAVVAVAGGQGVPPEGATARFLSLLYGELVPYDGGVRCTVACAGHPLPLLLDADGRVRPATGPQMLLGVVDDETYTSQTFDLLPGDTLLCVTDGVTERRTGGRLFDDGDGLAKALADCAGLDAELVAERIRRLVHEFSTRPPDDDLALLVLQAR